MPKTKFSKKITKRSDEIKEKKKSYKKNTRNGTKQVGGGWYDQIPSFYKNGYPKFMNDLANMPNNMITDHFEIALGSDNKILMGQDIQKGQMVENITITQYNKQDLRKPLKVQENGVIIKVIKPSLSTPPNFKGEDVGIIVIDKNCGLSEFGLPLLPKYYRRAPFVEQINDIFIKLVDKPTPERFVELQSMVQKYKLALGADNKQYCIPEIDIQRLVNKRLYDVRFIDNLHTGGKAVRPCTLIGAISPILNDHFDQGLLFVNSDPDPSD